MEQNIAVSRATHLTPDSGLPRTVEPPLRAFHAANFPELYE
jgi:hypothetical protein